MAAEDVLAVHQRAAAAGSSQHIAQRVALLLVCSGRAKRRPMPAHSRAHQQALSLSEQDHCTIVTLTMPPPFQGVRGTHECSQRDARVFTVKSTGRRVKMGIFLIGRLAGNALELQQGKLHGGARIINGVMGPVLYLALQELLCDLSERRPEGWTLIIRKAPQRMRLVIPM
jgi:hypothetical protein